MTLAATCHPTTPVFPSSSSPSVNRPLQGPRDQPPAASEFPTRAGGALDGMRAPDAAAPPRQPQPHVGLLLPPPPPTGPARSGCRRRRDSDAGGRWASDSGEWNRDVNLSSSFFSLLPTSWTRPPYRIAAPPLPVHVTLWSLLSSVSPRPFSLLFCRLPVSSISGVGPVGLSVSAARKPRLFAGSFGKRKTKIPRASSWGSLLNS